MRTRISDRSLARLFDRSLARISDRPLARISDRSLARISDRSFARSRVTSSVLLAAMFAVQLAWVSPVRADDTAKAKAMFTEGLALEQSKDWAAALAKFEGVAKVKKTPQVMFHVAYCQERVGRMVEALALYKETLADATAGAADPKLAQVKTTTEEAIAALEKKIPTVTITSKGPKPSGAEITLDGKKIAALDKPEKVDPGVHTVEAKAEGKEPFSAKVDAPEESQRTVEIRWKDTKKAGDVEPDEPEPAKPPPAPPPPVSSSKLPFVVGGLGVASLIASGVFFGIRTSAQSELEDKCQGTLCPESVRATGDRGKMATTVSNVTLVVGLVGLGAGITLYALDSKKPASASLAPRAVPRPTQLRAGFAALPGAGVATFTGAF